MDEWQTIETAPRNTPFLGVLVEEGYEPYFYLIRGLQIEYAGADEDRVNELRWNGLQGAGYNIRLTHWMPLPAPPLPTQL